MYLPDIIIQDTQDSSISDDTKQCQNITQIPPPNLQYEIVPAHEVSAASTDTSVDIRPRVRDGISNEMVLIDCGSQVSVVKPGPEDTVKPHLKLETVDGSFIPCFGKK